MSEDAELAQDTILALRDPIKQRTLAELKHVPFV